MDRRVHQGVVPEAPLSHEDIAQANYGKPYSELAPEQIAEISKDMAEDARRRQESASLRSPQLRYLKPSASLRQAGRLPDRLRQFDAGILATPEGQSVAREYSCPIKGHCGDSQGALSFAE